MYSTCIRLRQLESNSTRVKKSDFRWTNCKCCLQIEDPAEDRVRDVHAVHVVVGVGGVDEGVGDRHRLVLDSVLPDGKI